MQTVERRYGAQARSVSAGSGNSPGTLVGYASVFNSLSENLGNFYEKIAYGAFDKSLRDKADVRALVNHDSNFIVGRVKNNTLRLSQDSTGLRCECDLPDTSTGRDLYQLVSRGDISAMSFAFTAEDEDWGEMDDPDDRSRRIPLRTIRAANLMDTSFVVSPAYSQTSCSVASALTSHVIAHSARDYFPEGLPAEIRSRVGAAIIGPRAKEARRRLFSLFIS